ncbi:O-antigen ligase [Hyphomonas sp. FCG-A18]|jgi:O-antigen ligase|uniref:O-antigen ligase family protein n=1 Tax=Hyphomonas sp. FCG-A18 TaxID=3080019 RepID=UPI002B28DCDC|nr:O-antigen ligase [Hyphomonas sp. FCG-A18]
MHASQTVSPAKDTATKSYSRIELALLFIILIMFSEGLLPRLFAAEESAEGSPILRMMWLPVYALTLGVMIWQWKAMLRTLLRMPFMIALMGLAAVSFLWSIDPALSQRRGIAIVMSTLAGLWIGTHYDWRTLLRTLGLVWITVAVAGALTAIANPGFGVMHEVHVGAWKGLYYEKNQLGGHMARACFLCAFLFLMDKPMRRVWGFGVAICLMMVLMSTSKTSLLGVLLGFGILIAALMMKRGKITGLSLTWLGTIVIGSLTCLLIFAPEAIFNLLGRDASLTGRTDIWAELAQDISERPLLGYGYGAFWMLDSEPAYWLREVLEWDAPTAHNSWLEVAIALGLTGLAFLLLDFAITIWRALRTAVDTWTGVFALGVCAQFALFSISESIALQQNSLIWLTYVIVAAKLANTPKGLLQIQPIKLRRPLRRLASDAA